MKIKSLLFFTLAIVLSACFALVCCGKKDKSVNKLTAEYGITADGAFENGSALNTERYSSDSEQGKAAVAAIDKPYDSAKVAVFDITLTKGNEKVQPSGKVKITMPKPFEADGYVTYHVKGDNTVEELSTVVNGNNIYFETTGFSYFVVAGLINAEEQHIHVYVEKVTDRNLVDNATCQRKAVYRLVCSICGSLGRETFEYGELAPHNLREEKGYDPWCEKDGLTHGRRCINAGCTYTEQTAIPAIGHNMQDVAAKEPTCTEIGWKAYRRCENYCGKIEGYEEIPATGHNLSITVPRVEPTCERWGSEEYTKCSNEGCDYHTEYNGLQALGHDKEWHDPCEATCTEDGYWGRYATCKREGCDYSSKVDRYVDKALGHLLKRHEAKEADCMPGWEAYDECQREGCEYNTKVENLYGIFYGCSSLTSLDVSSWNTSAVTDIGVAFYGCGKLTSLDLSSWNIDKVTQMHYIFYNCSSLKSLDVSKWNTAGITDMEGTFYNCSSLTSLDLSGWNTGKVKNMSRMFNNCGSLASLDVSSWDTSKVEKMSGMFFGCGSLTSLDVSSWDTSKVNTMYFMFRDCGKLNDIDVSSWNTANVTDMSCMFYGCGNFTTLDLSSWNTASVTDMSHMFLSCVRLASIYVGNGWNTDNASSSGKMFTQCKSLSGGKGTSYDDAHTDKAYARIDGGAENPGYFTDIADKP